MSGPIMRYDASKDERVPVTQEWVHQVQFRLSEFASQRRQLQEIINRPIMRLPRTE